MISVSRTRSSTVTPMSTAPLPAEIALRELVDGADEHEHGRRREQDRDGAVEQQLEADEPAQQAALGGRTRLGDDPGASWSEAMAEPIF